MNKVDAFTFGPPPVMSDEPARMHSGYVCNMWDDDDDTNRSGSKTFASSSLLGDDRTDAVR